MSDSNLPTEVELAFEVMPCSALRTAQEPGRPSSHPCAYFRTWGRYHSYDYREDGPPAQEGIVHQTEYVGRAPLVPELLSGCRKAPIMAVGINPNLPGWWKASRNAVNPLFDEYKQYAHYFRYRTTDKLRIPRTRYAGFLGGQDDSPHGDFELDVPADGGGVRAIPVELQAMAMYENYQSLLLDLAAAMGWPGERLSLGEDLSYGNMVACPSAKWITRIDPQDPDMPPMTPAQQRGIVGECFRERRYFLRQLFQSLPAVVIVFSQGTADAFIGEMAGRFSQGDPRVGDRIAVLLEREVRLRYGTLPDGSVLDARVIFSPHITGTPAAFGPARAKVLRQLVAEAQAGRLGFDAASGHLRRPRGACSFCTTLQIGPCDYESQLSPLAGEAGEPGLLAAGAAPAKPDALADKRVQGELLERFLRVPGAGAGVELLGAGAGATAERGWELSGDPTRHEEPSHPPPRPD